MSEDYIYSHLFPFLVQQCPLVLSHLAASGRRLNLWMRHCSCVLLFRAKVSTIKGHAGLDAGQCGGTLVLPGRA